MKIGKTKKGVSLIEVVVAMASMIIILYGTSIIFSATFQSYRSIKESQRNVEEGQYILTLIAKIIRTSTIQSSGSTPSDIRLYDYSQDKCFRYWYNAGNIMMDTGSLSSPADTDSCVFSSALVAINSVAIEEFKFDIVPSAVGTVGKVTMMLKIGSSDGIRMQTSVSLRDYSEV